MKPKAVPHALRTCIVAVAIAAVTACGSSTARIAAGKPAPAWSDPIATGGELHSASLRGKAVYLDFFATWCPPCNDEAPWVEALQQRYASRGLVVVGVDMLENRASALRFRAQHSLTYPVVVDSGTLEELYSINGLPVHVFITRNGIVNQLIVGEMSKSEIDSAVQAIVTK